MKVGTKNGLKLSMYGRAVSNRNTYVSFIAEMSKKLRVPQSEISEAVYVTQSEDEKKIIAYLKKYRPDLIV